MDDLNIPLEIERKPRKARVEVPYGLVALGLCGGLVLSLVTFVVLTDDRLGGEPFAVSRIEHVASLTQDIRGTNTAVDSSDAVTGSIIRTPTRETADQVEQMSGVKVLRPGGTGAPGAMVIEIPDNTGVQLVTAPDKRLVEPSKYGPLPKIGADGLKPMNVYARPLPVAARPKTGTPIIAVVFGGVGLSSEATQSAIANLPEEVTLGFAPYGKGLEAYVKQARDAGHELVLQVPMESFDYPANSAGPETLLTTSDEATNLAHLRMLMAKMTGYIGLMNYQGGKFTADAAVLSPIVREAAARGLLLLDDGSSPRSLVTTIGQDMAALTLRGNIIIDGQAQKDAINAELAKLEAQARTHGFAIGIANGYPVSIDMIAAWASSLQARGMTLVPLSAIASQNSKHLADQKP